MKNQPHIAFWQKIHKTAKDNGFLLRVMFELTYRCNFNCRHCYVPRKHKNKKGELNTKEVFSVLDQLADIGCFYLGFTGGEPFMRKDILDILRYAVKKGFQVIVYTNGSLINKKVASELGRLSLNKIDITIPAMHRVAFEKITQVSGSCEKVFTAIELLRQKGVRLGFKTCVLKENEKEIAGIQNFAASLRALHRIDNVLSPRLDGSVAPYKYRGKSQLTATELPSYRAASCQISEKAGNRTPNTGSLFKCGVGISQAAITPFGELKMCLMIDHPKYKILSEKGGRRTEHREKSLKDAWNRMRKLAKDIKPDKNYKCDQCGFEPYCKWCPAKAWLYNRSFTSCEPESRAQAEFRKQIKLLYC